MATFDPLLSGVHGETNGGLARTLGAIVDHSRNDDVIRRHEVCGGDQIIIRTRNSVYSLWVLGDGTFAASGGWFDSRSSSPTRIPVNGCTYGGSAIRHDVIAGKGLFLEFGNRVLTTRIQEVRVVRFQGAREGDAAAMLS
jgi:hypothetical protein